MTHFFFFLLVTGYRDRYHVSLSHNHTCQLFRAIFIRIKIESCVKKWVNSVCCGERDEAEGERLFEEGFNAVRINSAEEFRKIMEAMEREVDEGGGMSWVSPDFDMEEIEKKCLSIRKIWRRLLERL